MLHVVAVDPNQRGCRSVQPATLDAKLSFPAYTFVTVFKVMHYMLGNSFPNLE